MIVVENRHYILDFWPSLKIRSVWVLFPTRICDPTSDELLAAEITCLVNLNTRDIQQLNERYSTNKSDNLIKTSSHWSFSSANLKLLSNKIRNWHNESIERKCLTNMLDADHHACRTCLEYNLEYNSRHSSITNSSLPEVDGLLWYCKLLGEVSASSKEA